MNVKKVLAVVLAVVLLMTATIAGTIAWLMDETEPVVNTFTIGAVDITLKESPYTAATSTEAENYGTPAENVTNQYPAIPGNTYKKDPVVTVTANSEKCYLFVEFTYTENADTYLNYISNLTTSNQWTQLGTTTENGDGTKTEVWYRVVDKQTADQSWDLLADLNENNPDITLEIDSEAVTKDTMNTAATQQLKWTAYAVQFENVVNGNDEGTSAAEEAYDLAKAST